METSPAPQGEEPGDRDQPDHSEDVRDQDSGGQGYPESQPEGASPHGGTGDGPEGGTGGEQAPDQATDEEGDREQSTGNPHAAG